MNLAHPIWLLLLPVLPVLAVAAWLVSRFRNRQWTAFVADRLRHSLLKGGSPLPRWFALISLLLAAACLSAALARPYANAGSRSEKIMGRNVMFAIDLSRSMRVTDVKPDRLSQAKIIAYELMESMPDERIGLIGFAGDAYLCAPLTIDHGAVRETIEQMDESWATRGGTNLSKTVKLAITTLRESGQRNNALVIISDGEKHEKSLDDAIQAARQAGIFIISIGIGTEDGDYVPNPDFPSNRMVGRDGKPILSRLDKDALSKLASETNGTYIHAGSGAHIAGLVRRAIDGLEAFEIEGRERTIKVEFYQWFTFPAALFLMFSVVAGTRWRKVATTPATALLLISIISLSHGAPEDDARDALQSGNHAKALSLYKQLADTSKSDARRTGFQLGEAMAAYRSGDLSRAQSAYSQALLSPRDPVSREAHLGLGNTLFQEGWQRIHGSLYPVEKDKIPQMSDFDAKVRELLRATPEDGSSISTRIEFVITSWTDAVRHYDTVLASSPTTAEARDNRELTLRYLRRLAELLKEEEQQTKQSMPEQMPEPTPDKGGENGEQDKKEEENKDGSGNKPDPEHKDGTGETPGDPQNREGKPDPNQPRKNPQAADDTNQKPDKSKARADESPQDQARRQLKENADLERGPLTPGRREFLPPEKDW